MSWPQLTDLMELVSGGQNDGWKQKIEKELIVEADGILDPLSRADSNDQTDNHTCIVIRYHELLLSLFGRMEGHDLTYQQKWK